MEKIGIVIPAHNEEDRISQTLKDYINYFKKLKMEGVLDFLILVVLNACTDNTGEVVSKFKCLELDTINFKRPGKGFAIAEGFKKLTKEDYDLIGFIDADGATPPNAFYGLIKNVGRYDGIIANRWDKMSKIIKQTFLRRVLSRGFNFLIRTLFPLPYKDTQCGAKLFKKHALKKIENDLYITHWAFDINLLYALNKRKFKINVIPTEWTDKEGSKINVKKVPLMMFIGVVRLRLLNSFLKDFLRLYDRMPEWIKLHHRWR